MSQPDNSKLATASSPIRMRVQGMDCAKDAAEIERAARSAGVADGWTGGFIWWRHPSARRATSRCGRLTC